MSLHTDAVRALSAYDDPEPDQRAIAQAMLAFLAARPDGVRRSCVAGHITASALVVDPASDGVLLTLHPRVGRWLQLGGHCEADARLADAALREAREESGIAELELDPEPLHLDVHALTCSLGVPTRHLDVRFLAVAPTGARAAISTESLDLAWFRPDRLPEPLGEGVPELVRRGLRRIRPDRNDPRYAPRRPASAPPAPVPAGRPAARPECPPPPDR